jgi:curli production assembly/transport component CsgG
MRTRSRIAVITFLILFESGNVWAQDIVEEKIKDLSMQLTEVKGELNSGSAIKIAILGFASDNQQFVRFRNYIRTELEAALHQSGKFTIVSRDIIDKIIEEQKRGLTGMFDPAAAKNIGKLMGADALIIGNVTDLGSNSPLRISAQCYSVRTGALIAEARVNLPKFEQVKKLLGDDPGNKGKANGPILGGSGAVPEDERMATNGIAVRLLKCRRESNVATCQIKLTNKNRTNPVGRVVISYGRVLDEFSNTAMLRQILRDGQNSPLIEIASAGNVEIESVFEGVSMDAKKLAVVEIMINGSKVSYTDVCLSGFCGNK